ncbi:MAG: isoprenylcysteine carboxylmethyltransferase family protein [Thermoguttaceae bacterium]|nr:isoprenylcysteine carboxylmethyltransferase family protein [Thermoguttaceae bacterium]MDW8078991.1 isoprenylcysteine carboxylmethyltransferase family protein [Thermoguttaceae bacterium]
MAELLAREWHFRLLLAACLLLMPLARMWWNRNLARPESLVALRRNRWDLIQLVLGGNLILVGVLAYIVWYDWVEFARLPLPTWMRLPGIGLAGVASVLLWWGDVTLGENISFTVEVRAGQRLVREGPYRFVRHPIYLGALLFFLGLGWMTGNAISLFLMVGGWSVIMSGRIPREEKLLLERFGEDYRTYQTQTGCLIPRLSWASLNGHLPSSAPSTGKVSNKGEPGGAPSNECPSRSGQGVPVTEPGDGLSRSETLAQPTRLS